MAREDRHSRIRIMFVDFSMDDPKRATMRKLERFGLARRISPDFIRGAYTLTPFAQAYLMRADRNQCIRNGMCVLEASWNRIEETGNIRARNARKLPLLLPVNPVNYGKPGKLSSVEAVAGALAIIGLEDDARMLLSKFSWAQSFLETNKLPLMEYSQAETDDEIRVMEHEFF
ncbi:MAG: DUF367 family protein [Candidatus Thermoplasmatota archaeon]|jgi:pre-rRNA-processing protein TSR3|nr:DUF367 family protein [Candidatus Thermoplasmatota archaeon]MCL5793259.1 DUF367 family protein [Candidatus Thermoplasmatota archaeon]